MTEAIDAWHDFNVAIVGAAAALAGLVIVAASVNIAQIVKATTLTSRLAVAIAALVLALVVSGVGLVPGIDAVAYGVVILAATIPVLVFQAHSTSVILRDRTTGSRARPAKAALGYAPLAAYAAAGILLVADQADGFVWAAVGALVAIVAALVISWIVLVEVLR